MYPTVSSSENSFFHDHISTTSLTSRQQTAKLKNELKSFFSGFYSKSSSSSDGSAPAKNPLESFPTIKQFLSDTEGAFEFLQKLNNDNEFSWKLQNDHIDQELEKKLFSKLVDYLCDFYSQDGFEKLFHRQKNSASQSEKSTYSNIISDFLQAMPHNPSFSASNSKNQGHNNLSNEHQKILREDVLASMRTIKILARNLDNKLLACNKTSKKSTSSSENYFEEEDVIPTIDDEDVADSSTKEKPDALALVILLCMTVEDADFSMDYDFVIVLAEIICNLGCINQNADRLFRKDILEFALELIRRNPDKREIIIRVSGIFRNMCFYFSKIKDKKQQKSKILRLQKRYLDVFEPLVMDFEKNGDMLPDILPMLSEISENSELAKRVSNKFFPGIICRMGFAYLGNEKIMIEVLSLINRMTTMPTKFDPNDPSHVDHLKILDYIFKAIHDKEKDVFVQLEAFACICNLATNKPLRKEMGSNRAVLELICEKLEKSLEKNNFDTDFDISSTFQLELMGCLQNFTTNLNFAVKFFNLGGIHLIKHITNRNQFISNFGFIFSAIMTNLAPVISAAAAPKTAEEEQQFSMSTKKCQFLKNEIITFLEDLKNNVYENFALAQQISDAISALKEPMDAHHHQGGAPPVNQANPQDAQQQQHDGDDEDSDYEDDDEDEYDGRR